MKKLLVLACAAVVAVGAMAVYAGGDGCCMGKKAKADGQCSDMFSKLNLTDEQKAKVNALHEECAKATSTSEAREKFNKGIEGVLTPEQLKQWKADCDKAKASCGAMKDHAKADDTK